MVYVHLQTENKNSVNISDHILGITLQVDI